MQNYGNFPFGVLVLPLPYRGLYFSLASGQKWLSTLCLHISSGYFLHQMCHL